MTSDFGFIWPRAFVIWAVALLFFVVATRRASRIREESARILQSVPSSFGDTKILILVSLLLASGVARPYWGSTSIAPSAKGRDIVLVLDVSASMRAMDSSPSRFQVMQREVNSLLEVSNSRKMQDRFGIVAFAGASAPLCPLTVDRSVVARFLRAIDPGIISTPGSGIDGALNVALDMIERSGSSGAGVILVSDGEGSDGTRLQAVERARNAGVTISVLGIGTETGATIPGPRGDVVRDSMGNTVTTRLNSEVLQSIASGTRGVFEKARAGTSDVTSLYNSLAQVERDSNVGVVRTVRNELTPWCALAAFLLFLGGAFRSPTVILPLVVLFLAGSASQASADAETAAKLYKDEDYEGALDEFTTLQRESPDDPAFYHGAGSAAYRLKQFDLARENFDKAARIATHPRDKFEALFNSGNALFQAGKYKEAIERYDAALSLKPGDEPSIHNRALSEEALLKKEEAPTPTPPQESSNENKQGDSTENNQSNSNEESANDSQSEKNDENSPPSNSSEEDGGAEPTATPSNDGSDAQAAPAATQSNENRGDSNQPEVEAREGAEAWLESLPDAPLLMRRDRAQRVPRGDQTW